MKKRIFCLVLVVLLALPSLVVSAEFVTMYQEDGRTKPVHSSRIDEHKKEGWYEGVTMYAKDGRTITISPFKVVDYKKVGWYEGFTMYATDGRTIKVSPFKVADYKKVGWYDKKSDAYTLVYSADGRITDAPKGKVEEYIAVGWKTKPVELKVTEATEDYQYGDGVLRVSGPEKLTEGLYKNNKNVKTLYVGGYVTEIGQNEFLGCSSISRIEIADSVTKIRSYAFDDTKVTRIGIPKSVTFIDSPFGYHSWKIIENNLVVYCEKGSKAEEFAKWNNLKYVYATMIYCGDGRTMMVDDNEKALYLASGLWFDEPITTIYTLDGRSKVVKNSDVAAYSKVGWYDSPIITMYAADGRTKKVPSAQKEAYKKVGWYEKEADIWVTMYAADGRTKKVLKANVAKEKAVGWFDKKSDLYTLLYSTDGRVTYALKTKVAQYTAVGWKTSYVALKVTEETEDYKYGDGVLRVFGPKNSKSYDYKYTNNQKIKTVYIGGSVNSVARGAFSDCSNLSRVEISDKVTDIYMFAFDNTKITRIGIPKSVTYISYFAFDYYGKAPDNLVIYCEKDSEAEAFAKRNNIKYVYASMIYNKDGRTMMVDANEKATYLASGLWY